MWRQYKRSIPSNLKWTCTLSANHWFITKHNIKQKVPGKSQDKTFLSGPQLLDAILSIIMSLQWATPSRIDEKHCQCSNSFIRSTLVSWIFDSSSSLVMSLLNCKQYTAFTTLKWLSCRGYLTEARNSFTLDTWIACLGNFPGITSS